MSNANNIVYQSASCSVSGQVLTLNNAFRNLDFVGGNYVSFRVGPFTNPISVRDIGSIVISTLMGEDNSYYAVDSVTLTNVLSTTPGSVYPYLQTDVSSFTTYDKESVYIFNLKF